MTAQKHLFGRFVKDLPCGELIWIGVRPVRKAALIVLDEVEALAGLGLQGDHRCSKTPGSARQVTLISAEFIQLIEHYSGHTSIDPGLLRRNLVVKGINLNALRHQQFRIGEALFEATALCHPCSRMDQALGRGGLVAMLGYGGLCATIIEGGRIAVGDTLTPVVSE